MTAFHRRFRGLCRPASPRAGRAFLPALCLPLLLAAAPAQAAPEDCELRMALVKSADTYHHQLPCRPGRDCSYDGPVKKKGGRPARLAFSAGLKEPGPGGYRLDYRVELSGGDYPRPPFSAQGKAALKPGGQLLAAEAGGWQYYLKLEGPACGGKFPGAAPRRVSAALKCGRRSYHAEFSTLPNEQYSAVLNAGGDGGNERLMIGLLPGTPAAFDGSFELQYVLQLKDAGETVCDNSGKLVLTPGEGRRKAAAGRGCLFTAGAD